MQKKLCAYLLLTLTDVGSIYVIEPQKQDTKYDGFNLGKMENFHLMELDSQKYKK